MAAAISAASRSRPATGSSPRLNPAALLSPPRPPSRPQPAGDNAGDFNAGYANTYPERPSEGDFNPILLAHISAIMNNNSNKGGEEDGDGDLRVSGKPNLGSILTAFDIIGLFSQRSPFHHFVQAGMKPKALRDRAKSLWQAVAIISALIATVALANLTSSQPLQAVMADTAFQAYGLLNFLSGVMNIFAATVITVAWAGLESTPMDRTNEYFSEFYYVAALPGTLFVIGGVFLLLAYLTLIHETFSSFVFYASASTGIFVVTACLILQKIMHARNLSFIGRIPVAAG